MSVAWDSAQPPAIVSYAPRPESVDVLLALPPAALGSWFENSESPRRRVVRAPRPRANEQLSALASSSLGVPWESMQSRGTVAYAPRVESIDVLLPLDVVAVAEFGPWLDSPPVVSRYTIITLAQEDAAELGALPVVPSVSPASWQGSRGQTPWRPRRFASVSDDVTDLVGLPPPGPYFDMAEPWARGKVPRSEQLRLIRVHDDALPGLGFSAAPEVFVPVSTARTSHGASRIRISRSH